MAVKTALENAFIFFVAMSSVNGLTQNTETKIKDRELQKNHSALLDSMIKSHDARLRPNVGGPPVKVHCNIFVYGFGDIDEIGMDYTVDIFLRQRWNDHRLSYDLNVTAGPVTLPPSMITKIWTPDLFFVNEKSAKTHDVTMPNKLLKIFHNGTIIYSMRLTLVLTCPMILTHFPMDRQKCRLEIESFGYDINELIFIWDEKDKIQLSNDLELPQFNLSDYHVEPCEKKYITGEFSCLKCVFLLEREFGFFLLQTYIPSILIVILSWLSFWIHADAVPARISLGVTTVLTMTTQLTGSKQSLPKVSYPKAIDVWMAVCMLFVFGSLLEYAFVNVLQRKAQKQLIKFKKQRDKSSPSQKDNADDSSASKNGGEKKGVIRWYTLLKDSGTGKKRDYKFMARAVDKMCRVMFPLSFLLFNIVYWSVYSTFQPE